MLRFRGSQRVGHDLVTELNRTVKKLSCKTTDRLIEKDPDPGKDKRQEEKGKTEDEMVGWHHRLDGHEFEHSTGVGDGQGSWRAAWGHK